MLIVLSRNELVLVFRFTNLNITAMLLFLGGLLGAVAGLIGAAAGLLGAAGPIILLIILL